jgi:chromate transporter
VLPLLQQAVVPPGWVGNDAFLAGYGAAQAVPGSLFTFAAYLGTVMGPMPNGWIGALISVAEKLLSSAPTVIQKIEFGPDSPLEGDGFEHSVPGREALLSRADVCSQGKDPEAAPPSFRPRLIDPGSAAHRHPIPY